MPNVSIEELIMRQPIETLQSKRVVLRRKRHSNGEIKQRSVILPVKKEKKEKPQQSEA